MSKRALTVSLALVTGVLAFGLAAATLPVGTVLADDKEESSTVTSTFHVTGMTCGGCEVGVRRTLEKLDGVEQVTASYKNGSAMVTYDPVKVNADDLVAAIEKLGYKAELQTDEDGDR